MRHSFLAKALWEAPEEVTPPYEAVLPGGSTGTSGYMSIGRPSAKRRYDAALKDDKEMLEILSSILPLILR